MYKKTRCGEPGPRGGDSPLVLALAEELADPQQLPCFQPVASPALAVVCLFFGFGLLFFCFSANPRHMEVPRLGVQSELQLLAFTTATATQDPSRVCDPYHNSCQRRILHPLSEAKDRTRVLMDDSQICFL